MRDRILEIVVFLIDYLRDDPVHTLDSEDVSNTLHTMGFSDLEISSAYAWLLERINHAPENYFSQFPQEGFSHRVLAPAEQAQLAPEAYGFLITLRNLALASDEQVEAIMERASVVGIRPVSAEQIRVIASSVLFQDFDDFDDAAALGAGGNISERLH